VNSIANQLAPGDMNKILIPIFLSAILITSCAAQDCTSIKGPFSSYEEASRIIIGTKFKVKESVNTRKSSWIKGAEYYSCDGLSGFFILKTAKKDYIHQNVPILLWREFKAASSFGKYYNEELKNKFQLRLNF
jgi:hypothetical protein